MNHPKASPFSRVEQKVGLSKIIIEYSRPSARGRTLFGNQENGEPGLVPYGRIWRVGANESTKISFDSDVIIDNQELKKGIYALYAFPEKDQWQIVFHNNSTHWGDGRTNYNPKEDALRILVLPIKTHDFQETFLISFDELDHNRASMIWSWGNTQISIPIQLDTKSIMQRQIDKELSSSASAQTFYETARYYQEQGIYLIEALSYVDSAIEKGGDTYYYHRIRSLILADLNRYTEAIKVAELSLELARKEGKDEFVRLNENNIRKWQTLLPHNK
ncbi:hypothetical protein LCGC14_0128110 [marine sediment metagenome]|uniref:DUF2911 domain-containing protein n=2 Tax=root TaxID=1 RepID=A0A0F9VKL4_9ZZZZ|nr:DUF2911 domain-containing protein [Maribacter sp.]HEA80586.1 DUF2911 domain-containing protein [Maribacter sp.]